MSEPDKIVWKGLTFVKTNFLEQNDIVRYERETFGPGGAVTVGAFVRKNKFDQWIAVIKPGRVGIGFTPEDALFDAATAAIDGYLQYADDLKRLLLNNY